MIKQILNNYKKSYKFFVPFEYMVDDGIIVNKNSGFQATFKVRFFDLDYQDNSQYINTIENINNAIKRLPDGMTIHFEVQRTKSDKYPSKDLSNFPYPTQIIERLRENSVKHEEFYITEYYLTLVYILLEQIENKFDEIVAKSKNVFLKKQKHIIENENEILKEVKKEYVAFQDYISLFVSQYQTSCIEIEQLKGEELLGYLYKAINNEKKDKVKCPKNNEVLLDEYLTVSTLTNSEICKINDDFIKVLTINVFPDEIMPRIFNQLENLNFEYRYVTRYIILDKEEAVKLLKSKRVYYNAKLKSMLQWIIEGLKNQESGNIDRSAANSMEQITVAMDELKSGAVSYGYYTFTFLIRDKNLDRLNEKIQLVKKVLNFYDFISGEDKYNTLDSIFGSIPGNIVSNVRKTPMSSYHISTLLPMSSLYVGNKYNKHLKDVALFTTKTEKDLFYFNLHNKDIGHTSIVGPTGAGKSFLLGMITAEFLKYDYYKIIKNKDGSTNEKYKKAQVFFFDKDASCRVLTNLSGGKFYDLGKDNLAFQPLKNVDSDEEKEWALQWLSQILYQEEIKVDAKKRTLLWEALKSLADMDKSYRTLSNFISFLQDSDMSEALTLYSGTNAYGKYFDSDYEYFEENNFVSFEMGEVIKNEKVITPLLEYIFHKIEKEKLDGTPTLIVLDECWVFLKNENMANKMAEWLKVLRKKNTSVIFATQSLQDISESTIASSIIDACKTNIFLPNEKAMSSWKELYKKFNLNDIEIQDIAEGKMKRDYFVKSSEGSRIFSLNSSATEIALIGSSSKNEQSKIMALQAELDKKIISESMKIKLLNREWINYKLQTGNISKDEVVQYLDILKI